MAEISYLVQHKSGRIRSYVDDACFGSIRNYKDSMAWNEIPEQDTPSHIIVIPQAQRAYSCPGISMSEYLEAFGKYLTTVRSLYYGHISGVATVHIGNLSGLKVFYLLNLLRNAQEFPWAAIMYSRLRRAGLDRKEALIIAHFYEAEPDSSVRLVSPGRMTPAHSFLNEAFSDASFFHFFSNDVFNESVWEDSSQPFIEGGVLTGLTEFMNQHGDKYEKATRLMELLPQTAEGVGTLADHVIELCRKLTSKYGSKGV